MMGGTSFLSSAGFPFNFFFRFVPGDLIYLLYGKVLPDTTSSTSSQLSSSNVEGPLLFRGTDGERSQFSSPSSQPGSSLPSSQSSTLDPGEEIRPGFGDMFQYDLTTHEWKELQPQP